MVAALGFEGELVQDGGQGQHDLVEGELAADAGAGPGAEGLVDVRGQGADVVGQEAVGAELVGVVAPGGGVAVCGQ